MLDDLWICNNCGCTFSGSELVHSEEHIGDAYGTPAYYQNSCCPHCGSSDFDEAAHCELCDKVVSMDDLKGGACPACWGKIKEKYAFSAVRMAELFKSEEAEIKLNPFLIWAFNEDKERIEALLLSDLWHNEKSIRFQLKRPITYEDFLEDDEEATVQLVAERGDIDE